MQNKTGFFSRVKRNVGKSKEYTADEKSKMDIIHRSFIESQCGKEIPIELRMNENDMPYQEVATEDSLKSFWIPRLREGLLSTEADTMVGDICAFVDYRSNRRWFKDGNSNDPYNLFSYYFLTWLTRTLSGAPCDKATLNMVKAHVTFLVKIESTNIFPPESGAQKNMLDVLVSLRTTLQHTIIPIINREIANFHAREHLQALRLHGKNILNYGFQFLYYVLSKTKNLPPANITSLSPEIAQTKRGKLLECLIETSEYRAIFGEKREFGGIENPFADSENKLCIPEELLAGGGKSRKIVDFLGKKDTGIFEPFRKNSVLLEAYLEMHALLVELARAFSACEDAYDLAGIGGDLLAYSGSNQQINELMETLKKLCNALSTCHGQIRSHTSKQEIAEAAKKGIKRSALAECWLENYGKLSSINQQLEGALTDCNIQAAFVQTQATKISPEERLQSAKDKTLFFSETAVLLSNHITHFLKREPTPQLMAASPRHRSGSSLPLRSRSMSTISSGVSRPSMLSTLQNGASNSMTIPTRVARSGTSLPPSPRNASPIPSPRGVRLGSVIAVDIPTSSAQEAENAHSSPGRKSMMGTRRATQSSPPPVQRNTLLASQREMATTLDLRGQQRSADLPLGRIITDDSIDVAIQMLSAMPNVVEVMLMDNKITAPGAAPLCEALRQCKSLQILNLSNNPALFVDDMCGKYVGELLRHHSALEQLFLSNCGLTLTSVCTLANALRCNTVLECLDIGNNNLDDDCLHALCLSLEQHTNFNRLNISDNRRITDAGGGHILELLKKNPNILEVNLNGTGVSAWMIGAIRERIRSNSQLLEDSANPFTLK